MFHIAICDDEEYFRIHEKKLIEQYMENCGYTCRISLYASGKDLLKQTDNDLPYDVIFLDINMEEMDGLETAERIRKLSKTVYIVFVTAYITYALEGYKVGAVRYLLKEDNSLENSLKECLDTITVRMNEEKAVYELEFQGVKKKIPADALLYVESRLHKVVFFELLPIRTLISLAVTAFVMYRLFQISYLKSAVLCMFCDGASLIASGVAAVFLSNLYPLFELQEVGLMDYIIVGGTLTLCRIVCWGILLCLSSMIRHRIADILTVKEWGALFALSLITIFSVVAIGQEINRAFAIKQPLYFFSVIVGMLFVNFIVYYLIGSIVKRELKLREHAVFIEKVKNETAMYHSISENLEQQRKRTHEYKNQLAVISALAAEGNYQELRSYIGKIETSLQHRMDAVDTNHVIVNAILNTKYREAVNKGIVFVLKVNDLSGVKMEKEDIVIIISNLLDNALEACEQCAEKRIKFKFVLENGQIVISVKNSMAAEPVVENGKVLTSKTNDAKEHGMGIQNIVEAVEKYGGRYMVDYGKSEFQFSILIPNEEKPF